MANTRIYELAKELDVSSKDIIEYLATKGIKAKSQSSLNEDICNIVREEFGKEDYRPYRRKTVVFNLGCSSSPHKSRAERPKRNGIRPSTSKKVGDEVQSVVKDRKDAEVEKHTEHNVDLAKKETIFNIRINPGKKSNTADGIVEEVELMVDVKMGDGFKNNCTEVEIYNKISDAVVEAIQQMIVSG